MNKYLRHIMKHIFKYFITVTFNHNVVFVEHIILYIKKHKTQRFSVNMFSIVTNQGQVRFVLYTGSMNADKSIEFMLKLIEEKEQKAFLILDNLRVHHSKILNSTIIKQWVEENKEKIELIYLPPHSPDKNPDEYSNCDLNKVCLKNQHQKIKNNCRNKESHFKYFITFINNFY